MPIYAYRCRECENDFEVKQRFSDDPLTTCEVCGTEDSVFRVIQPAGVVFKGSGFYVTDTRGKNAASPANGNGSSSNGNGSTEKKSENGTASANGGGPDKKNTESSASSTSSSTPSAEKKAS